MDTIVTSEGRSQMGTGNFKPAYVSFSDMGAIYALDTIVSGGLDVTYRFNLEAGNLPQDMIVLEADDSGKLLGTFVSGSNVVSVANGQILSGSHSEDIVRAPLSGSQFNSTAQVLLLNAIDNFKKQYLLGSPDPIDDRYDQFIIGPNNTSFDITENKPISQNNIQTLNVDQADSLFTDKRLSHLPNFKFLPPVNKKRVGQDTTLLGNFVNLNQESILTYSDVLTEINDYAKIGYEQVVSFVETSRANNLVCQLFEISNGEMIKLDVVDFGLFPPDSDGKARHVFFAGKVYEDSYGVTTYCHIMTLVWE